MAIYPSLKGKVAVVTGAAKGIGKVTAVELAKQGCSIGLVTRKTSLEQVRKMCLDQEVPVSVFYANVGKEDEVKKLAKQTRAELGNVHILVNCAGGFPHIINTLETTINEWDRVITDNLTSAFLCSKYFIPMMQELQWGRIIQVSSESGRSPRLMSSPQYAAAKAGMINFARHLALEVGQYGITVNSIAPGTTLTERVTKIRSVEIRKGLNSLSPLGRLGEPIDQANAILFLASEESSYITGAVIDVNGGRSML